jgi:gamma-glutamyltranspeptidase/glutathione hydrolase
MKGVMASAICSLILLPALANWAPGASDRLNTKAKRGERVNLSPERWPKEELEKQMKLELEPGGPHPQAEGARGAVVGTSGSFAVRAGLEALKQGGSAADAAMAASMAQIVLMEGSAISFAGIMTMVYYDAATGKVYSMNAGYDTVREETEPLTIPTMGGHSGRTALVPGFLAGVQAAHDRFGKLPFASLFDPSVYIAEKGILLNRSSAGRISSQKAVLSRLPETKAVFTKENGEFYSAGDLFKQPRLAGTLRRVAEGGADHIYKGEWARHFVDAVRSEGGKVTMQDMANYKVIWSDPLQTSYRDYNIATLGLPSDGGVNTVEAFNLLEAADLKKMGHYTESAEALYWFMQIAHFALYAGPRQGLTDDGVEDYLPGVSLSARSRLTKENARLLWQRMHEPGWASFLKTMVSPEQDPKHSAGVVAVDEKGNVAAVVHSINTVGWGSTGIFVDGISIPDSACFQQQVIKKVGPGVRLPDPTNPLIVLKNGKPVLASSSIGSGLHMCTLQNIVNILDFGMEPKKSVDTPNFMGPFAGITQNTSRKFNMGLETVWAGDFPDSVVAGVRAKGQEVEIFRKGNPGPAPGYWIGIKLGSGTRRLLGAATPLLNGQALAY